MPAQFQRGRRYARAGQVRQLTISSSLATALVLDENGLTYRARIAVRAFSGADWNRIERALARRAVYAARLLAGQLPDDLDRLLAEFGLSLFPESLAELAMDCTCPDRHVPCRHLTATCYALAQSFDEDPFGILAWRGRGRDELLELLRRRRVEQGGGANQGGGQDAPPDDPGAGFWTAGPRRSAASGGIGVPGELRRPDALLDQLERLRLTAGRHEVLDLLRPAYEAITGD